MNRHHLRLIDEQGEVHETDECPNCSLREGEIVELTKKLRGMARELAELRKDRDAEARSHESWPVLYRLFCYWRDLTGHKRAVWKAERFWVALPHLQGFGQKNLAAGIAGIAANPYIERLSNGKLERHDSWETLFADTGRVERYIRRRPQAWSLPGEFNTADTVTPPSSPPVTIDASSAGNGKPTGLPGGAVAISC